MHLPRLLCNILAVHLLGRCMYDLRCLFAQLSFSYCSHPPLCLSTVVAHGGRIQRGMFCGMKLFEVLPTTPYPHLVKKPGYRTTVLLANRPLHAGSRSLLVYFRLDPVRLAGQKSSSGTCFFGSLKQKAEDALNDPSTLNATLQPDQCWSINMNGFRV